MNRSKWIKEILVGLVAEDKLPADLTSLDASIFDQVFKGMIAPGELKNLFFNLNSP